MMDARLERMQAMAKRFNANGSIDQLTMRRIDALVISAKRKEMAIARIKKFENRVHINQ
ncbi:hypothetical protein PDY_31230 [Photobacterium damselae subsp. damselae]|uniref:hypothetical protein n=1 Tax=Photobacterium damselae TaxID=38293 RepID=UPI0022021E27|nr:hypothetical protein [Photobacterium damselae]BDR36075.1 hypothetical protein PDY_31230 [Photobacterium damselae subsp. damselae]